MYSTSYINSLSDEAAVRAAKKNLTPYAPWNTAEVDAFRTFPFPFIGSYCPAGWTRQECVLADATGLGEEYEPALTARGLKEWAKKQIQNHPGKSVGFAIIETGQFQVMVASFTRDQ